MDYLDPEKKRQHRIRLFVGYGLMAVAISIATVILVYIGSGWYLDSSTGDLIQNGQLFVNSAPEGSSIYVNGELQKTKTPARLVIPSGSYKIEVKRSGYADWMQNVALEGGRIQKMDYIRMVPTDITAAPIQTFADVPSQVVPSGDRRFMALVFDAKPSSFFVYDLTKPDLAPVEHALPVSLYSQADQPEPRKLQIADWAGDNKHILLQYQKDNVVTDYVLVSRDQDEAPVNVSAILGVKNAVISFRDRQFDQYYIYKNDDKTLNTGSLDTKSTLVQKLTDVFQYKTYGPDAVLYVPYTLQPDGKAAAKLLSEQKTHLIRELTKADNYLLDISKTGSALVIAVGAAPENKVTIVKNPLGYLKANPKQLVPAAATVLQLPNPTEVYFSTDASVVAARSGQKIASHYFEEDRSAKFDMAVPITSQKLTWLDGKHLKFSSNKDSYMVDFDGANLRKLASTNSQFQTILDNNYQSLYSFSAAENGKLFNIYRSSMLAKEPN